MIVSLKLENIYAFNGETRILFTAGKSDSLPMHVSRAEKRDDISVLRMGLIYGANASGKSNIIIVTCFLVKSQSLSEVSQMLYRGNGETVTSFIVLVSCVSLYPSELNIVRIKKRK